MSVRGSRAVSHGFEREKKMFPYYAKRKKEKEKSAQERAGGTEDCVSRRSGKEALIFLRERRMEVLNTTLEDPASTRSIKVRGGKLGLLFLYLKKKKGKGGKGIIEKGRSVWEEKSPYVRERGRGTRGSPDVYLGKEKNF